MENWASLGGDPDLAWLSALDSLLPVLCELSGAVLGGLVLGGGNMPLVVLGGVGEKGDAARVRWRTTNGGLPALSDELGRPPLLIWLSPSLESMRVPASWPLEGGETRPAAVGEFKSRL